MKKILIVDDEAGFSHLIKVTLERAGDYRVLEENDSTHALETARKFMPDLILLDMMMPRSDGGDVASRLQEDEALCGVPIVFLTASVSQRETTGGLIGGFPFISKPVSLDALLRCIQETLLSKSL